MKILCCFFIQTFLLGSLYAQENPANDSVQKITAKPAHVFTKLQRESEFPGGQTAWVQFLSVHLVYPAKAIRKKVEGTVLIGFIVETDGSLSEIKVISGPELLQDAALKVIKESPHWVPSIQNGIEVKSYKKQPIIFHL